MKVGILVTNGGPHSASKWAEQTAAQIVDIIQIEPDSLAFDALTAQKNDFETEITKALSTHHDTVQQHEADEINVHGLARLSHDITPEEEHINEAVSDVQKIADKKLFGSHFRKPEVVEFVRNTVGSHFATSKHIERSWHADRNIHTLEAQEFKNKYHSGLAT